MGVNPIIKIKKGSTKPANYSQTVQNGIVVGTTGLTAGELGVILTPGNYNLYIGNTLGQAITYGCEISTDATLGGATPSDAKIPTQKAIKDFASTLTSGSAYPVQSRIAGTNTTVFPTGLTGATGYKITFSTADTANSNGTAFLTANTANNTFTNSTGTAITVLVTYQIAWSLFTATQSYGSRNICRAAWIQKNPDSTVVDDLNSTKYGFTNTQLPILATGLAGAMSGSQSGSSVFRLANGESFSIMCRNYAPTTFTQGGGDVVATSLHVPVATTAVTLQLNATRFSAIKL